MNNIFVESKISPGDIQSFLLQHSSLRHKPGHSFTSGIVQATISQPLPFSTEDAENSTFLLADFGCAQSAKLHDDRVITVPAYRAPEAYMGGEWDMAADIWAFACMAFDMLSPEQHMGHKIFHGIMSAENSKGRVRHLWTELIEENIGRDPKIAITEEEAKPLADMMKRCLVIDPAKRAAAQELSDDPFFTTA
ncbi:hypothetical protein PQX77_018889 [Marasmius sp. AFHP31]|nr:hypothetical protein PQX77_018889 [Marasmius sp. AFHP31]